MSLSHLDVYKSLSFHEVRYLVIGGLAVNLYGLPRSTKDMDLFIAHTLGNCENLLAALKAINFGTAYLTDAQKLFENEVTIFDDVLRVDVLTKVKGLQFDQAWANRNEVQIEDVKIPFVSFDDLMASKEAAGRKQDLDDVAYLKRIRNISE